MEVVARRVSTSEKQDANTWNGIENLRVQKLRGLLPWPTTRDQGGLKGSDPQRPPSYYEGCTAGIGVVMGTPGVLPK